MFGTKLHRNKKRNAFTLVEILIVVVIMAILAAVLTPTPDPFTMLIVLTLSPATKDRVPPILGDAETGQFGVA